MNLHETRERRKKNKNGSRYDINRFAPRCVENREINLSALKIKKRVRLPSAVVAGSVIVGSVVVRRRPASSASSQHLSSAGRHGAVSSHGPVSAIRPEASGGGARSSRASSSSSSTSGVGISNGVSPAPSAGRG